MKKFAVATIILSALTACSQNYSPVAQAALTVRETTDARAADEINAFLESRGYKTRTVSSSPGGHWWYEGGNAAFVEIETDANHCITFIAFVKSGSTDLGAAKSISQDVINHFGRKWSIKRDQVCA